MIRIEAGDLPDAPLDAAAAFHQRIARQVRAAQADVAIVFAGADYRHAGWRRAAVGELARELAPRRINALVGGGDAAQAAALRYLAAALGVTGQLLALDGHSAGEVLDGPQCLPARP